MFCFASSPLSSPIVWLHPLWARPGHWVTVLCLQPAMANHLGPACPNPEEKAEGAISLSECILDPRRSETEAMATTEMVGVVLGAAGRWLRSEEGAGSERMTQLGPSSLLPSHSGLPEPLIETWTATEGAKAAAEQHEGGDDFTPLCNHRQLACPL